MLRYEAGLLPPKYVNEKDPDKSPKLGSAQQEPLSAANHASCPEYRRFRPESSTFEAGGVEPPRR